MYDARLRGERLASGKQRRNDSFVAIEHEGEVGPALERNRRRGHDDPGSVIAAHHVERDANVLLHR